MAVLAGILCGVGAAAIYASGKSSESEANALNAATRINHLADLAQMFGSRSKGSPLIVAVTGQVGSDAPIKFEHTSVQGVIEMETGNQNYMVKKESGEWVHGSVSTLAKYKVVPWYLEDETSHVHVVGAEDATGLVLEIVKRTFQESGGSLARGSFEDFQRAKNFLSNKKMEDFKMLGVTQIVSILPMGKSLTVVGEAIKDDSGNIHIQRCQNAPFYVSPHSIDQIIADRRKSARISKFASAGLTLLGVSLIAGEYAS